MVLHPHVPTQSLPITYDKGSKSVSGGTSKFSAARPSDGLANAPSLASHRDRSNSSESDSSDPDSGNEQRDDSSRVRTTRPSPMGPAKAALPKPLSPWSIPRFPRTLSMPLPSQLGYLKHPHRSEFISMLDESFSAVADSSRIQELSIELADSVQMMIQTMLQISPPQLLDRTKEQLSACSLSVPTSSMTAMLTSMRDLNYISAHMGRLCSGQVTPTGNKHEGKQSEDESRSSKLSVTAVDFDIGEMLQSVGDSLSSTAAQAGVELVLYHGADIDMRHIFVKGDEHGTSYALSHVIRRVLETTQPGDSIELGLLLGTVDANTRLPDFERFSSPSTSSSSPPPNAQPTGAPLVCRIRISHKFGQFKPSLSGPKSRIQERPQPALSSVLLTLLLNHISASLDSEVMPHSDADNGRIYYFILPLRRGSTTSFNTPIAGQLVDEEPRSGELSAEQLMLFAGNLKGKKVLLYAKPNGSFALHLTRYLTAWGMDITLVSPDVSPFFPPDPSLNSFNYAVRTEAGTSMSEGSQISHHQSSFIFIDDDLEVLKERLRTLRDKSTLTRRPPLTVNQRSRSAQHVNRAATPPILQPSSVVIVHFTSLSNYKLIKDIVQSVIASHQHPATTAPVPEVMIIPKPAGPRRFLTALYMAMMKPTMDPLFVPIATAPTSPPVHSEGSFYDTYHHTENSTPHAHSNRPPSTRHPSDRSAKGTTKDLSELCRQPTPVSSPHATSDGSSAEYFPETAVQLGTTPSSGLVIQSPDGQPTGIFFHPKQKGQRTPSGQAMERDRGQLGLPPGIAPGTPSRVAISNLAAANATNSGGGSPTVSTSPLSVLRTMATPPLGSPKTRKSPRPPYSTAPSSGDGMLSTHAGPPTTTAGPKHRSLMNDVKGVSSAKALGDVEEANLPALASAKRARRRTTMDGMTAPAGAMAAASSKMASGGGNIVPPISVLIVDDNPINRTILSEFMRKKGITFEVATNGQEAVQKWKTGGFHLILMDIQMPIMDGIQATKEIRQLERSHSTIGYLPATPPFDERPPPLRTPSDSTSDMRPLSSPFRSSVIIVALTASSLQADRVAALAAGCNDFLTKPVSLVWLNSKIIEWGSIKALQRWADPRPDLALASVQVAHQARAVAERLHVPSGRRTPSPGKKGKSVPAMDTNTTARGVGHRDGPSSPPSPKTLNEIAKDLAQGGRRSSVTPTG